MIRRVWTRYLNPIVYFVFEESKPQSSPSMAESVAQIHSSEVQYSVNAKVHPFILQRNIFCVVMERICKNNSKEEQTKEKRKTFESIPIFAPIHAHPYTQSTDTER